jgi:hypothetical protein
MFFMMGVFCFALAYATPSFPEDPSPSTVDTLVKGYVDEDFIHEELPPPTQCEKYSEKLMFAYEWEVVVHKIGPYDPARKLAPVEATVIVRCGPFRSQPPPSDKADASVWPLRSETPIEFQLMEDSGGAQPWKVHDVTLWKSKQKVVEK